MRRRWFGRGFSWVVCSTAMLGCSSTGTGGSGGSGTGGSGAIGTGGSGAIGTGGSGATGVATCESACNHLASLPCLDQDGGVPGCVSDCQTTSTAQCAAQFQTYLDCVSTATITCDANGVPNISTVCGTENRAYSVCAACLPASTDDACDTCSKSSCCTEYKALVADPHLFDYADCLSACADITCLDGCLAQYPSVEQSSQNYVACQNSNCATACP